jgi:hypothetical protein
MRVLLNLFQAFLGQFKQQANIEQQYSSLLDQHIHMACKFQYAQKLTGSMKDKFFLTVL